MSAAADPIRVFRHLVTGWLAHPDEALAATVLEVVPAPMRDAAAEHLADLDAARVDPPVLVLGDKLFGEAYDYAAAEQAALLRSGMREIATLLRVLRIQLDEPTRWSLAAPCLTKGIADDIFERATLERLHTEATEPLPAGVSAVEVLRALALDEGLARLLLLLCPAGDVRREVDALRGRGGNPEISGFPPRGSASASRDDELRGQWQRWLDEGGNAILDAAAKIVAAEVPAVGDREQWMVRGRGTVEADGVGETAAEAWRDAIDQEVGTYRRAPETLAIGDAAPPATVEQIADDIRRTATGWDLVRVVGDEAALERLARGE